MAKVALIVGHGDRPDGTHDPGAVGGGWSEQTAGQVVGLAAADVMLQAGVVLDPNETLYPESDPNYKQSTADANRAGADLVLSIHFDWIKAPEGSFALWISDAGRRFGDSIEAAVADAGFKLRAYSANPRDDLYLLNNTNAPAVIFECGRIGEDALDTEEELAAMGRAIGRGVLNHLGIEEDMPTIEEVRAVVREELRDQVLNKDLLAQANIGDWVTDKPQTLGWMVRTIRKDASRAIGLLSALASDNDNILAAIADAEGLTVDEVRAVLTEAVEGLSVTFDNN